MFQTLGDLHKCGPCCEQAISIWLRSLSAVMLGEGRLADLSRAKDLQEGQLPMAPSQLSEVVAVLGDLRSILSTVEEPSAEVMIDAGLAISLLLVHMGRRSDALFRIDETRRELGEHMEDKAALLDKIRMRAQLL